MTKLKRSKFVKYVVFAVLATVINVGIYIVIYNYVINSILISNLIAYIFSISFQFITNRKHVFKMNDSFVVLQIALFVFVKLISFWIDSGVLYMFKDVFGFSNFISKIASNASTTLSNYLLNNKWVFRNREIALIGEYSEA